MLEIGRVASNEDEGSVVELLHPGRVELHELLQDYLRRDQLEANELEEVEREEKYIAGGGGGRARGGIEEEDIRDSNRPSYAWC